MISEVICLQVLPPYSYSHNRLYYVHVCIGINVGRSGVLEALFSGYWTSLGGHMSRASVSFWEIRESEHHEFEPWSSQVSDLKIDTS